MGSFKVLNYYIVYIYIESLEYDDKVSLGDEFRKRNLKSGKYDTEFTR